MSATRQEHSPNQGEEFFGGLTFRPRHAPAPSPPRGQEPSHVAISGPRAPSYIEIAAPLPPKIRWPSHTKINRLIVPDCIQDLDSLANNPRSYQQFVTRVLKLNEEYTQQAVEEAWKKLIYQKYKEMNRKCDYEAERVAYNVGLLRLAQSQVRNALNMSFF